jgi:MFS family permease
VGFSPPWACGGENIMYYLVVTFSITYLKVHVHANTRAILWWLLVAHAVHFFVIPLFGSLTDRFGRRPVYFVGAVATGLWGFFAFPMMNSGATRSSCPRSSSGWYFTA